jgi:hypothetical protein
MGAILEADRHNIRSEHISVDTIPLVGERDLAAAVRSVVLLPRVKLLVLAGSLMGGNYEGGGRRPGERPAGDLTEYGRQRSGSGRPRGYRSRSGRGDGGDGRRRYGEVRFDETAE